MSELEAKIERYEGFLAVDPENTMLMISLGDLYHQDGQFSAAKNSFQQVLNLTAENAVAASRLANVLMSEGKLEEALAAFQGLGSSEDPALELNKAICQFALYRLDEAKSTFLRLSEHPLVGRAARFYLASIMQMNNRVSDALIEVERLLTESSESYLVAYKATLLYTLGRLEEAVTLANQVLAVDSTNPDACSTLGTFYCEQLDVDMAKTFFDKMVVRAPGDARGWHGLGIVAVQQGFTATAIELFEKAVALLPRSAAMWTSLAWAHFNDKQFELAASEFGEVIAINRNNAEGWGGKACTLAMQTKLKEADEACNFAFGLDKRSFSAIFAKSLILALKGKKERGDKILANLLEQPARPGGEKMVDTIQRHFRLRHIDDPSRVNTQPLSKLQ